jgi:hypothetical protein
MIQCSSMRVNLEGSESHKTWNLSLLNTLLIIFKDFFLSVRNISVLSVSDKRFNTWRIWVGKFLDNGTQNLNEVSVLFLVVYCIKNVKNSNLP